jgi:hypothetical protein
MNSLIEKIKRKTYNKIYTEDEYNSLFYNKDGGVL